MERASAWRGVGWCRVLRFTRYARARAGAHNGPIDEPCTTLHRLVHLNERDQEVSRIRKETFEILLALFGWHPTNVCRAIVSSATRSSDTATDIVASDDAALTRRHHCGDGLMIGSIVRSASGLRRQSKMGAIYRRQVPYTPAPELWVLPETFLTRGFRQRFLRLGTKSFVGGYKTFRAPGLVTIRPSRTARAGVDQ